MFQQGQQQHAELPEQLTQQSDQRGEDRRRRLRTDEPLATATDKFPPEQPWTSTYALSCYKVSQVTFIKFVESKLADMTL